MTNSSPLAALPRGPRESPVLQTAWWLMRPLAFLESCRRRFGDTFTVRFVGHRTPLVIISDPVAIRALYSELENRLTPGRMVALGPLLGSRSIVLQEGTEHLQRRRLMLPPFHGQRIRAYEDLVAEIADDELDRCPMGQPFALHPHLQHATLEVILKAVFGVSDPQRSARLRRLLPRLLDATSSGVPLRRLVRRARGAGTVHALRALRDEIDRELFAEISERRSDPAISDRQDILSRLIGAQFEDGSTMDDHELRDQLMTLLIAGHDTTATTLAWTFDLLLRNRAALARLIAEVDQGDDDTYLRAVIAESLRLRPVVPFSSRRIASELRADGFVLPPGTDVYPATWLTHTRPDLYPQPFAFRPERFLEKAPTTYGWIPFGGGVHRCLGAAFAEMEMRVVLRSVLRARTLTAASAHPERPVWRGATLSPQHGTRITMSPRSGPVPARRRPPLLEHNHPAPYTTDKDGRSCRA
jgi:cytochrome P450 family 135